MHTAIIKKLAHQDMKLKCLDSCLYDFTDSVECKITAKTILKKSEKQCPGESTIEENRCLKGSWEPPVIMLDLKRHLGGILGSSWPHLGAILGPSWAPKSKKCRLKSMLKIVNVFESIFLRFGKDFGSQNGYQIHRKSKKNRREKMIAKVIYVLINV